MSTAKKNGQYSESGIQLTFDRGWVVKRYDQHTYFQGLSGVGLKGVDFIGIWEKRELLLLEIKNYRRRPGITANPIEPYLNQPELLVETFADKVLDTLKAIETIVAYYQRSWFYRLVYPVLTRLPTSPAERVFWTHAYDIFTRRKRLLLVFWMELDPDQKAFFDLLQPLLEEKLKEFSDRIYLSGTHRLTFEQGLTVHLKT